MGMNTNLVAAFDFRAMLTQVKDFCTEYGFYFAIAAAALFLIWIITWIALGVKCRRLKKKNKALGIQNAGYASADEDRANEAARAEAYARAQKEESVSAPAPAPAPAAPQTAAPAASADETTASFSAPENDGAADTRDDVPAEPAYEYDDDTEEFDISVDDEPEPAGTVIAAGPQKETPGNYVVKYDRTKLSWIITKKGSQRVIRRVQTKEEALRIARELCKKTGAGLYVHKKDGKFQKI